MKSQHTKTKDVKFLISAAPADAIPTVTDGMLELQYTSKAISMTAPAGDEIDVSVLGSPTKETISGLPGEATISNEANLKAGDKAQDLLRKSYETGDNYAFVIEQSDGTKISFLARVTNYDMSIPINGIMTGTFNYKVNGFFKFTSPSEAAAATAKAATASTGGK